MAFSVRVFGYRGYKQIPIVLPQQEGGNDNVGLWQPYEWKQTVASNAATPVVAGPTGVDPDLTKLLVVEIPTGSSIRYEVKPPGSTRTASTDSPLMSAGSNIVTFEKGWTFQFIEGP